jgi:hypothetical protein
MVSVPSEDSWRLIFLNSPFVESSTVESAGICLMELYLYLNCYYRQIFITGLD